MNKLTFEKFIGEIHELNLSIEEKKLEKKQLLDHYCDYLEWINIFDEKMLANRRENTNRIKWRKI